MERVRHMMQNHCGFWASPLNFFLLLIVLILPRAGKITEDAKWNMKHVCSTALRLSVSRLRRLHKAIASITNNVQPINNILRKKGGCHMDAKNPDMEVTPERAQMIRETLIRLLEDQYGCKISYEIIKKPPDEEPA